MSLIQIIELSTTARISLPFASKHYHTDEPAQKSRVSTVPLYQYNSDESNSKKRIQVKNACGTEKINWHKLITNLY